MLTALLKSENTYTWTNQTLASYRPVRVIESLMQNFEYTSHPVLSSPLSISDDELTTYCMQISERSLNEDWENEDDERWNTFLNTPE